MATVANESTWQHIVQFHRFAASSVSDHVQDLQGALVATPMATIGAQFCAIAVAYLLYKFFFASKAEKLDSPAKKLKGPPGQWLLGNLLELRAKGYPDCHLRWLLKYGDYFKYKMGNTDLIVVADPDAVKDVCVKNFRAFHDRPTPPFVMRNAQSGMVFSKGAYWTSVRGTVLPLFHTHRLRNYSEIMHKAASTLCDCLASTPEGKHVDMLTLVQAMTLDVIGTAAFGIHFGMQEEGTDKRLLEMLSVNIRRTTELRLSNLIGLFMGSKFVFPAQEMLGKIPGTLEYAAKQRVIYTAGASLSIIKDRRANPDETRQDLVSILTSLRTKDTGRSLTDAEVTSLVTEFMGAGSDTTANTVAFSIYLLSKHPEAEKKVLAEIDNYRIPIPAQGDGDQKDGDGGKVTHPTFEELSKFPYIEQVVQETLRLYPTGAVLSRMANEDTTAGQLMIPKGIPVFVPVYAMHHNPKLFPDPESFRPERFDPACEEAKMRHPYAYIPFGSGPRMCIGYKFAMEEARLTLIRLYQRFTFRLVPDAPGQEDGKPLATEAGIVLKPKHGVFVTLVPRP
eukprot:SM000027S09601  [mRNA]  locus=s27:235603:239159:- [translate_table: standard]